MKCSLMYRLLYEIHANNVVLRCDFLPFFIIIISPSIDDHPFLLFFSCFQCNHQQWLESSAKTLILLLFCKLEWNINFYFVIWLIDLHLKALRPSYWFQQWKRWLRLSEFLSSSYHSWHSQLSWFSHNQSKSLDNFFQGKSFQQDLATVRISLIYPSMLNISAIEL